MKRPRLRKMYFLTDLKKAGAHPDLIKHLVTDHGYGTVFDKDLVDLVIEYYKDNPPDEAKQDWEYIQQNEIYPIFIDILPENL